MGKVFQFYEGKTVLLTGITGFLGKVIFEKFLRTLPMVKRIYVLIRSKKGSPVEERFKKVIHDSEIFERLRQEKGDNFFNYLFSKVVPIEGDLLKEGLGLSKQDYQTITQEANIVINCAASVDFNAKLEEAININVRGSLRMMELSKQCLQLENFVHVSTCYVNSDKRGWIEEDIYNTEQNARQLMDDLMKMPPAELERQTKTILGNYPNTYVFTKSAVERIIKAERPPNMTITIVRPSIIGAAVSEPCVGWVEGVTAASAVFLLSGIGMLKYIHANRNAIGDVVPVDVVSDQIIVTGALCANLRDLSVFNASTSSRNPMLWEVSERNTVQYWRANPPEKRLGSCEAQLIKDERHLRFKQIMRRIPALAYLKLSNFVGSENMKKNANRYLKIIYKAESVSATFSHFASNEWIFDSRKIEKMIDQLDEQEKNAFYLDVSGINWDNYILMFNWGMHRYVLNEKVEPPVSDKNDILKINNQAKYPYFSDINWALSSGKPFKPRSYEEYKSLLFNSSAVQDAISLVIEQQTKKQGFSQGLVENVNKEAHAIIKEMISNYKMSTLRMMAWFLHKVFKQIYEKVVIDDVNLKALANHNVKKDGPLIMIPTHRSYIDFLLVSYIFFAYKMQCPHIAAAEDFLNVTVVHHILRACGAFFTKRNQKENPLYKAIFYEYVQRLLMDDCMLEFFVEGTRSRSGKMLHPKFGIMGIVADAVFDSKIPDAKIVPITLNYDKVLEGDTFPYELLGEEKVKESLPRLIKAIKTLSMNFGRIHVNICEPMSIKQYLATNYPTADLTNRVQRKSIIEDLSYKIEYKLTDALVCMPTGIVSAIMLQSRKGITEDKLINKVHWVSQRIVERGGILAFTPDVSGSMIATRSSMNLLEGILLKTKKNVFELEVTSDTEYKNVLMLSYYRNQIVHLFILEAIVCVALTAFGPNVAFKEGVSLERIWEESSFLIELFEREYVLPNVPKTLEQFSKTLLAKMIELKVLKVNESGKICIVDENQVSFYNSLIYPLVESYWSVLLNFYTLSQSKTKFMPLKKFLQQAQWFTENMHDERIIQHHESCSLDTIKNAIQKYKHFKLIRTYTDADKSGAEENILLLVNEEKLNELETHIQKFLKKGFSQSGSVSDLAKRTLLSEYPILARL
ncbi:male sterility protein (macronuclear) [Tetrahymena thermophila SB210]|uniref:Male sterility protein n=1 Tax=Tetrahymena thermophila (strain SB210) TaxID=312017 RepID=I7LW01_TETTS|nr:male sterility protein [Tetrahymena thermophila SB210]EAS00429.1 male sterility protein [Tetrahymena thermophila SB210]|eukprot:XP_001020674.1 male sterility protein [Tetrahymena thermophila SB210]